MTLCKQCCWWHPNRGDIPEKPGGEEKMCLHPRIYIPTWDDFGCNEAIAADSTQANVPNHTPDGQVSMNNTTPVDGPVEILIVTHSKDFPWLVYALRSIRKYLTGFQGVTIAHPRKDLQQFQTLHHQFDVRLWPYDEAEGKGMIQHMAKMAQADLIVPTGTKYVLHSDADCIFRMPTSPADYFQNGKPYYLIRTWDSLIADDPRDPRKKVISDCHQWRRPTEAQLGFNSPWYTMCMNTAVLPIGFYRPYRAHIEKVQDQPFERYMITGQNRFPQTRMDWTAMGAWAKEFMPDAFTWIDVMKDQYPEDRKQAFWSHGGISEETRVQLEELLRWKATPEELERMTTD